MDLANFLIQILNSVQYGLLLFLLAAGLTLIFGIMGVVNLAHGGFYMIGAYLGYGLTAQTGHLALALAGGAALSVLLGWVLERLLFRHFYHRDHLDQVLMTFGLIYVLEELRSIIWGDDVHGVPIPELLSGSIQLTENLSYPHYRLFISVLCLLLALQEHPDQFRIALAAPTGKAAARLKQSIDGALKALAPVLSSVLNEEQLATAIPPATTLHSLLGARPDTRRLRHHAGNPLQMDVLVVDEASMIHLEMMANLLDALAPHTLLILLGDKDQLASVEAGAVMADLCEFATEGGYRKATAEWLLAATGQQIPDQYLTDRNLLAQHTAMLRKSRRFGGAIGQLAMAVNEGNAEINPRAMAPLRAKANR